MVLGVNVDPKILIVRSVTNIPKARKHHQDVVVLPTNPPPDHMVDTDPQLADRAMFPRPKGNVRKCWPERSELTLMKPHLVDGLGLRSLLYQ